MKKPIPQYIFTLNREEEAIIQSIAEKVSEQISQVVTASLIEMFLMMRMNRIQPAVQQTMTIPQADEFLTAGDLAGMLKISKSRAYQMIKTREIASFCIGKSVRVRREDLNAYLQAHRVR